MTKKLTRHGNSLALIIDKPILQLLKITEDTELELSVRDGVLFIQAASDNKESVVESSKAVDKAADQILKKYKDLFDKLSKT